MFRLLNRLMEISGDGGGSSPGGNAGKNESDPAATLRGIEGALAGRTIAIGEGPGQRIGGYLLYRIGRGPDNDLSFPSDTALNPRHAALYRVNGQWYCRDLDSSNGTLAGGKLLRGQSVPIAPGAELRFGRQYVVLDYTLSGVAAAAAATKTASPDARPVPFSSPVAAVSPKPPLRAALASPSAPKPSAPASAATPWRWIPPGETVTIRDWVIPGGMLYVGRKLPNLQGYGTEPSLINPALKVPLGDTGRRDALRAYSPYGYQFWGLTYSDAEPGMRRLYLDWLAGGRRGMDVQEPFLLLFFYGVERRLIDDEALPPPDSDERALLQAEIERMMRLYGNYGTFQRYAHNLMEHLQARRMIESEGPPPNVDALLDAPAQQWQGGLPLTLEITLARMARDKTPLLADLAYAWVRRDPDASSPRMVLQRCPGEVRQLWAKRYDEANPKGIRIPQRKTPLRLLYRPASPSLYNWAGPLAPGGLLAPSPSPLKALRQLLDACCNELDPFSRFVGRHPEMRAFPLAAALLPSVVRGETEPVRQMGQILHERLPPPPTEKGESIPPAAFWKGKELLALLTGRDPTTPWKEPLTRSESLHAAALLETVRVALEPDVRRGGVPLAPDSPVSLARLPEGAATGDAAIERDKSLRPPVHLLAGILIEAATEATGETTDPGEAPPYFAPRLAAALGAGDAGDTVRIALLLSTLLSDREAIRVPRQAAAFAHLEMAQRQHLGALVVEAASYNSKAVAGGSDTAAARGGGRAVASSPALVRRLSAAYRLLGLDETALYEHLHHGATMTAVSTPFSYGAGSDAALATVREGVIGGEFRLPPPAAATNNGERFAGLPPANTAPVSLDAAAIRRKEAETAAVGRLLHDIFAEPGTAVASTIAAAAETPPSPAAASVPADAAPPEPASGGALLDNAHRALLETLVTQDEWSAEAFAAAARAHGLLPGAALETINEAAWAVADEAALEGSDPVFVNAEAAGQVSAQFI